MKVRELLEKKLDEMNVRDYESFVSGLGCQFAVLLRAIGINDLKEIDQDVMMAVVMEQQIVQTDKGGHEYVIVSDVKTIRDRLLGAAG